MFIALSRRACGNLKKRNIYCGRGSLSMQHWLYRRLAGPQTWLCYAAALRRSSTSSIVWAPLSAASCVDARSMLAAWSCVALSTSSRPCIGTAALWCSGRHASAATRSSGKSICESTSATCTSTTRPTASTAAGEPSNTARGRQVQATRRPAQTEQQRPTLNAARQQLGPQQQL